MNFSQYVKLAQVTSNKSITPELRWTVTLLGLNGELGEVMDLVKKHLGHNHVLDVDKLKKELGDVIWYIADAASVLGVDYFAFGMGRSSYQMTAVWRLRRNAGFFTDCFEVVAAEPGADRTGMEQAANKAYTVNALQLVLADWESLVEAYSFDRDEILQMNIDKLKSRYPMGFEASRSQNRTGDTVAVAAMAVTQVVSAPLSPDAKFWSGLKEITDV